MVAPTSTNGVHELPEVLNRGPSNKISVIVVGSGIGGLTAARECSRLGCSVRVFERQPYPVMTGDSFTIGASAIGSLKNFPRLQKEVERLGNPKPRLLVHKLDGTVIRGPQEMKDVLSSAVDPRLAESFMRLSRPKLYRAMLDHLEREGVKVQFGSDVVDYFENEATSRAGIILKDGSKYDADVVVAADGVNSHSWKLVLGREVQAKPTGDAVFRIAFPIDEAMANPLVAEKYKTEDGLPMMHVYMGGDFQIYTGIYDDVVEWGCVHKDDGRAKESWDHQPSLDGVFEVLNAEPDVCKEIKALISTAPANRLIDWRIMWRDPQPQWASPGGRVVQLGDAGHTFHPSSGNGGTQAMEDGVSLANCISIAGKDNLPWATRVHNLLRFERVSCLQALGIASQAERVKSGTLPSFGIWIAHHNPETYAHESYQAALSHLQHKTPFKNTNTPPGMVYEPWTIDTLLKTKDGEKAAVLRGDWS